MNETFGAKVHNWILESRFVVAIFLIAFVGAIAVALTMAYFFDLLTPAEVRTTVSGVGAFGTLFLAIFTVLSVLETRKQTTERMKEQDKHIEERILSELNTFLDTVKENEDNLYDPEFEWANTLDGLDSEEAFYVDLVPLEIDHPTVKGRFEEEYEPAHDSVEAYNEILFEVDRSAARIVHESSEHIADCIKSFEITDSDGNLINTEEALNLVLSGKKLHRRNPNETDPEWWEIEGELRNQVQSCVGDELEKFYDKKQRLEVKSSVVRDELNSVRDYIWDEYPIQPENYPTS
jgi:hypothetical protein